MADEAMLEEWLFQRKKAEVLFALSDGTEVGFALFFHNFSTSGRAAVSGGQQLPAYRVRGLGRPLQKAGGHRPGAGMRQDGMVVPGLEPAQHRLQGPGAPFHGRNGPYNGSTGETLQALAKWAKEDRGKVWN